MKENCVYEGIGEREVPKNRNILKDELIELRGLRAIEKCPYPLRRIEVFDPDTDKILVFLTNHLHLGSTTISAIYKDRWQIEIFSPTESGPPLGKRPSSRTSRSKTLLAPGPMPSRSKFNT